METPAEWAKRTAEEQGLPEKVDDRATIARVAEIVRVPAFVDIICPVCRRTTYAPIGTHCQWDDVDLVPISLVSTRTGPKA